MSGDPCWHFRLDETLLSDGGVVDVAAGAGKTLAAVIALERLLPGIGMDSLMRLRWRFSWKVLSQGLHWNGFSPVWNRSCCLR